METYGVTVDRISGGSIYFETDETARFNEANMREFGSLRELAAFVRSIRSGWRYDDSNCRWTRVTRNHMTATAWYIHNADRTGRMTNRAEVVRLDSLPTWIARKD